VVAESNLGIIVTGDNTKIVANQQKGNPRGLESVVYGEIPRRPPAFQPRDDLRGQLLNAGQLAIISTLAGTRGIGKSQLAAAYARECIDNGWPLVAWIAAERSDQILSDLDQLSRIMGLHEGADDSVSAATKVRRWLETTGGKQCLIVFDNASDPDALTHWLPSTGSAQIIITSNRRSFESLGTLIDMEAFTPDEARTYLFERTGLYDAAGANALSEEVGRLPLALAQASSVIKAQRISYSNFLERLRKLPLDEYLTRHPGDAYPRGAAETVLLSVEQAGLRSRLTRALVFFLSVLSPDGVTRELLYSAPIGSRVIGWPWRAGRKVSQAKIDEALEQLVEASLVTVSFDGQTVIMHRFTQRVIREYADSRGTYSAILIRVSKFIAEQCKLNREKPAVTEHLIQQISSLWDNIAIKSTADIDNIIQGVGYLGRWSGRQFAKGLINLRIWSAAELYRTGNVARAIGLGTSVVRECETLRGPDHPDTLISRNCLGNAYRKAGRVDEAIDLYERALADHERVLGPSHPETLSNSSNLAAAYTAAGRVYEAIDLYERGLADFERILGPDHLGLLISRSNLGKAYTAAGRVDEAIDLHRRTLADFERILGPDHPDTLLRRNCLGEAYQKAGRVDEAIDLYERTLADQGRVLGPSHPDTLASSSNLASAYTDAGQVDEAIDLYERTLADQGRVLGPSHPDTLASRKNLYNAHIQHVEHEPMEPAPQLE
jgi:tetratricopeptide (TPR) repeat protein